MFTFGAYRVSVEQKGTGADCGFGAWAYATGEYLKVLPTYTAMDEGPGIGNLQQQLLDFLLR